MADGYVQLPADSDGKRLKTRLDGTDHIQYVAQHEPATFYAIFDRIVPGANKYMATLWNGTATRLLRVHQVWRFNWQIAAATGVLLEQELRRITARTAGTSVTPVAYDTNDVLTAGIAASHNDSAVTDSSLMARILAVNEEMLFATALTALAGATAFLRDAQLLWDTTLTDKKPITLRPSQGLTIKNITSNTQGSVSYMYEFTDEPL